MKLVAGCTDIIFSPSIIGVRSSVAFSEPVQAASKQRVHDHIYIIIAAKQVFESWHASSVHTLISLHSCLSKVQNGAMMVLFN